MKPIRIARGAHQLGENATAINLGSPEQIESNCLLYRVRRTLSFGA